MTEDFEIKVYVRHNPLEIVMTEPRGYEKLITVIGDCVAVPNVYQIRGPNDFRTMDFVLLKEPWSQP